MIPTTVSNSSPATASISAASYSSNITSNNNNNNSINIIYNGQPQISHSAMIGIASLILEGRAIAEDEYQPPQSVQDNITEKESTVLGGFVVGGVGAAAAASVSGSWGSNAGRQSPKPSTSRAAANVASCSGHVINITTNPNAFNCATVPLLIDPYNSSSASSSAESTHQRWTQKLCQLRQVSPAASLLSSVHEQKVAIQASHTATAEPELVALAINESSSSSDRADFEIVRRVSLNRATLPATGSASSSPNSSSDNFLHSLQSLATTCLRGSSPSVESNYRYTTLATSPMVSPAAAPKYAYQRTTPPRFQNPYSMDSASSSGSGIQSPRSSWTAAACSNTKDKYLQQMSGRIPIPTATATSNTASLPTTTKLTSPPITTSNPSSTYPQQGPHCDQFLRKMGLAKAIGESTEAEEHICDMSYVNITCSRWRAYCLKMEAIIARNEPVCIEVYLGPLSHRILLEQWIISQKEKVPPPTMTLPSLCSAIRSQLYFSQISAWCDLIKKSDQTIYENGRVIFPTPTVAAGDLATHDCTTTGTSPHATASPLQLTNAMLNQRPRLNIFYRIKQYDSTACFNSKPNVHNFPNVNISENSSISICLKSLPRINGGIPKVGTAMSTTGEGSTNATKTACPSALASNVETPKASRSSAAAAAPSFSNCDNKEEGVTLSSSLFDAAAAISGRHKCMFFIDEEELVVEDLGELDVDEASNGDESDGANGAGDSTNSSFSSHANISHRDKQLLKYRKRMLRRDKKYRKPEACGELTTRPQQQCKLECEKDTGHQPMEQCEKEPSKKHQQQPTHPPRPSTPQQGQVEMISTGTQTSTVCCQQCGGEKTFICISCNNCDYNGEHHSLAAQQDDGMDSGSSISSSDIITTPRNNAELLLQAIQRTPKTAKHKKQAIRQRMTNAVTERSSQQELQNNNHLNAAAVIALRSEGCHVCKRQKTQHNFGVHGEGGGEDEENGVNEDDDDEADGKGENNNFDLTSYSSPLKIEAVSQVMDEEEEDEQEREHLDEECFLTSTKLTPHIEHFNLYSKCCHSPSEDQTNGCRRCCSSPSINAWIANDYNTPTHNHQEYHQQQQQQQQQQKQEQPNKQFPHKQTPKPNLLRISCNYRENGASGDNFNGHTHNFPTANLKATLPPLRKLLPKINLTPIFCNPPTGQSQSSPIPINSRKATETDTFLFEPAILNCTTEQQQPQFGASSAVDSNNIPVQKSFSAPTLPNSPSLSPRFAKQAAIYKRRTRHLSDRSDRSSLGSDEQFSDDEFDTALFSPATSPLKNRTRVAALYGRAPLLGNLEESLLQKRILPKIEVMGFKVLLGASGGFCPTQLTIPANAWFYELQGETLSSPYMCEIHLPRKGYSVPRAGTIQATLLNPMGTVVRMFVIPYDMRDMPPLHQTFIRQRILAEASTNETVTFQNNNNNSTSNGISMNGNLQSTPNNNNNNNNNNGNIHKYRISPQGGLHGESNLGQFISPEHMKRLRYSIHLRFQTSRSGRLSLHTDIRLLISRRTDCDTAAAHAKGVLEAPNDLVTDTVMPTLPRYSARQESPGKI